jgi:adenosyl cobinamide kinase/adenosyl cobinamide phosphate guanylyltransferase
MIFVVGISRSGKSHTVAKYIANQEFRHVKASQLLRQRGDLLARYPERTRRKTNEYWLRCSRTIANIRILSYFSMAMR